MFTNFATFQCAVNGITFPTRNSVLIRCPLPCLATLPTSPYFLSLEIYLLWTCRAKRIMQKWSSCDWP